MPPLECATQTQRYSQTPPHSASDDDTSTGIGGASENGGTSPVICVPVGDPQDTSTHPQPINSGPFCVSSQPGVGLMDWRSESTVFDSPEPAPRFFSLSEDAEGEEGEDGLSSAARTLDTQLRATQLSGNPLQNQLRLVRSLQ